MVRKRVITLGLVLGLTVNQIMLYQTRTVAADNYAVPQFIMDDIQKNTGINSNKAINNYDGQTKHHQQVVTIDKNLCNQPQQTQYSKQVSIEQNVYQKPAEPQNNNYYQYQQTNVYDPNRPEWSEFCPYGLENVTTKDDSFHLWATNSRYEADNRNYWVDRRKDFEKNLAQCDSVQDTNARYGCYTKLRERQYRITANYVDPWQRAAIRDAKLQAGLQNFNASLQNQQYINAIKNQNINVNHSGTMNHNIYYSGW